MKIPTWLDSSAILTLLCAEPGTEIVKDRLERAERKSHTVLISTLSLTEIVSSIARVHGKEAAHEDLRLIREMPVQFLSPTADDCAAAGWLRAQHKLSTADAIIAAQALSAKAELIHKDLELESIPGLKQLKLPYKKTRH